MSTVKIKTGYYNPKRFGKPWIARLVVFKPTGKVKYIWGNWVGKIGQEGVLILDCDEGNIVARGQKDFIGDETFVYYYKVHEGKLEKLAGGKTEAYHLATVQVGLR